MKLFFITFATFALLAFSTPHVIAGTQPDYQYTVIKDVVEHGGGCRKDSPTGMCCHAGSKPYHCH